MKDARSATSACITHQTEKNKKKGGKTLKNVVALHFAQRRSVSRGAHTEIQALSQQHHEQIATCRLSWCSPERTIELASRSDCANRTIQGLQEKPRGEIPPPRQPQPPSPPAAMTKATKTTPTTHDSVPPNTARATNNTREEEAPQPRLRSRLKQEASGSPCAHDASRGCRAEMPRKREPWQGKFQTNKTDRQLERHKPRVARTSCPGDRGSSARTAMLSCSTNAAGSLICRAEKPRAAGSCQREGKASEPPDGK